MCDIHFWKDGRPAKADEWIEKFRFLTRGAIDSGNVYSSKCDAVAAKIKATFDG